MPTRKRTIRRLMNRPRASSVEALERMQAMRGRDTLPELALRSAVHAKGLRFRVDWQLPNSRRRADLAFPSASMKTAFEQLHGLHEA